MTFWFIENRSGQLVLERKMTHLAITVSYRLSWSELAPGSDGTPIAKIIERASKSMLSVAKVAGQNAALL